MDRSLDVLKFQWSARCDAMNRDIMRLGVWNDNNVNLRASGFFFSFNNYIYQQDPTRLKSWFSLRNVLFGGLNSTPAASGRGWTPPVPAFEVPGTLGPRSMWRPRWRQWQKCSVTPRLEPKIKTSMLF